MALYRLLGALGQHSLVTVLTRCGLALPPYFLVDEKHRRCLTDKVSLPTIVCGRVIWPPRLHRGGQGRGLYPVVWRV
jgi:hypothetical protein